jgi:SAM-dependent methyltransferase
MTATFEMSLDAAEVYENHFVPALFAEWAPIVVEMAGVQPGHSVLDVACGTGIVTRTAADRSGTGSRVVGLDIQPAMLEVARQLRPDLTWDHGDAQVLPYDDATVDRVTCQASLMFMPDPATAIREMARVVSSDGSVTIQVWGRLEYSTGLAAFADIVNRHAGPEAVELWATYFRLGDLDALIDTMAGAGLTVTDTLTRVGALRAPSTNAYIETELNGTPLGDMLDPDARDRVVRDARRELERFVTPSGIQLPFEGHVLTASRT